ncbi:hypothetical protein DIPPA_01220 [Diplonema papillatum]|nr:hypothetical protein DIPPA_20205 [Diplonema papillatum]KAJ9446810.1 hypothetical protein DIPPA_01220 [Diplonema papillatum]
MDTTLQSPQIRARSGKTFIDSLIKAVDKRLSGCRSCRALGYLTPVVATSSGLFKTFPFMERHRKLLPASNREA